MHKKNYVEFAKMIRAQRHKITEGAKGLKEERQFFDGAEKQLSIIVDGLVTIFKNDNPNFDADRFYSACEIEKEN